MHQRVKRISPDGRGRVAVVTSKVHVIGNIPYVDVIPEGCSRGTPEPWRVADLEPLPPEQQIEKLGGKFKPPKGYPMIAPPRHTSHA